MEKRKFFEQKLGSKGEIYLKKEIRSSLGLKPADAVIISIKNEKLIIEKQKRFSEIAKARTKIKLSLQDDKELDKEIKEILES